MKFLKQVLFLFTAFGTVSLFGEEATDGSNLQEKGELEQISRAMGHLIGKNLQSMGVPLDLDALLLGMKESCEGEGAPLSEDECLYALSRLQEETLIAEANENLQKANAFLETNASTKGIVSLEEGKLQYRVLKQGKGDSVEPYNSPILRYSARYLDGKIFEDSCSEEMISLDEAIQGLREGVIGMREGEVRTLYIHPELGYGRSDFSCPNALLVFEVEVLKADATAEAQAAAQAEDACFDEAAVVR